MIGVKSTQRVFTTSQVAVLCNTVPKKVQEWIDGGTLDGYRMPGSRHRRVTRESLLRFMRANELPMGDLDGSLKILTITADDGLASRIRETIAGTHDVACNLFEAGVMAERFLPMVAIVDTTVGRAEALMLVRGLKATVVLAVVGEDEPDESAFGCRTFRRPIDVVSLMAAIGCPEAMQCNVTS